MLRLFCIVSISFLPVFLFAQAKSLRYLVILKDKNQSNYSIHRPYEFLSPLAIQKRQANGIAIESSDLPISETYLTTLEKTGAQIHNQSKWMNSVVLDCSKQDIQKVKKLPFVLSVKLLGEWKRKSVLMRQKNRQKDPKKKIKTRDSFYGWAQQQIEMLRGDFLHLKGFKGQGKSIAVLDGGFVNMDIMPFFDSLRVHQQLLPSRDFIDKDTFVNEYTQHGSQVLSVMAANLPHFMVGTAPKANYLCLVTEEKGAESPVEEENFIAALEYADSLGIDIVNASLGYTTFDNAAYNYNLSDLDGQTARASIASNIAAQKGMLLVISAGNSGNDSWRGLGVPADALDVLTVAAVNTGGKRAHFSSFGFMDKSIKPNVAALGSRTTVASIYGYKVTYSDGTSFAAPLIAGMAASLWSAFPEASNFDIKNAIEDASSRRDKPNTSLGYGIPDFRKAYQILEYQFKTKKSINYTREYLKKGRLKSPITNPIRP